MLLLNLHLSESKMAPELSTKTRSWAVANEKGAEALVKELMTKLTWNV